MATVPYDLDMTEFDSPAALDAGGHPLAGAYHAIINGPPNMSVLDKDKNPLECFEVTFQMICGTTPGQERTQLRERFFFPKPNQKDGGSFCRRRLTKLALAAGIIRNADLGKRIQIDWADLEGMQVVLKVKERKWTNDKGETGTAAELEGMHLYHPLDPRVGPTGLKVPLDRDMIQAAIEEQGMCWDGDGGEAGGQGASANSQVNGVANGHAAGGPATNAQQTTPPAAAATTTATAAAPAAATVAQQTAKSTAKDPFAGL